MGFWKSKSSELQETKNPYQTLIWWGLVWGWANAFTDGVLTISNGNITGATAVVTGTITGGTVTGTKT